ncbi:Stress response protein [Yarrowia sp. C11]|nr:Stress response protein [Yarrowia sp. E02]KAG5371738.1 Stress response protein [Yarrowia sp. C11]
MEKAIYSKDGKRVINLKARETFKTENVSFEWGADDSKPKSKKKKKRKSKGQQVIIDSIDLDERSIVHGVMEAKMKAEKLARLKKSVNDTFPPSPASGLSPSMERQTIKYFWLSLTSEQRRELVQVEKEAVLNKMKRQQKNTCECDICGRKRMAIEQELETLYADYYNELDALAESKDLPLLPLPSMGFFQADDVLRGGHHEGSTAEELSEATRQLSLASANSTTTRPLPQNLGKEIDEEGDTEEDEPYGFEDEEGVQSLDVSSVADDLLTNDGKKFIEMMERLAEKRAGRIEEIRDEEDEEPMVLEDDNDIEEYENDSDYSDYSSEYSQTGESLTADQRMEEGRRMFQIFAARMFEQRVLHAYKQSVAAQVKAELQQMEEEKKTLDLEKEARDQQRRERKKEKKRAQKALKEEERKKAAAEREEIEKREREEAERLRLEEERKQQEKEKEKAARKAASAAKQKARQEEQERLAREKEEKRLARIREIEERLRLAKEQEEREKEEIRALQQKEEDERREKERLEEERIEKERLEAERLENERIEKEHEQKRLEEEQEQQRIKNEREQQKLEEEREKRASMSIPLSKPLPGKTQIPAAQPGTSLGGLQQPVPRVAPVAPVSPLPQSPSPQLPPGLTQHVAQSQILLDRLTPDPTSRMTPERHTPSPGSTTSNAKSLLDSLLRPAQTPSTPPSGPGTPRSSISHVAPVGAIGTIGSPGQPAHAHAGHTNHVSPAAAIPSHVNSSIGFGNIGLSNPSEHISQPISPPSTTLPIAQHRFDPWSSSYSGIASSSTPGNRLWGSSGEVPANVIRQAALDAYEELHKNGSIDCNGFVNSRALQNTAQKYSSSGQGFGVSELFKACQGSFDIVGGLMKPRGGL